MRLRVGEDIRQESAWGDGPVDATFKAINKIAGMPIKLGEYSLRAVTEGTEAIGEVSLKMVVDSRLTITGRGASTDILEASAKAYVDGLNKIRFRTATERDDVSNNDGA